MKNLILLNLYMNLEYKDKYLKYKKKYFQLKQQLGGALTSEVTDFLKKKKKPGKKKKSEKKINHHYYKQQLRNKEYCHNPK